MHTVRLKNTSENTGPTNNYLYFFREICNLYNDGGQKGVKVMRNNNDPWFTLYEALNVIYNPSQEAMSKKYVFGKALDEGLITYVDYLKLRGIFVDYGSWYS